MAGESASELEAAAGAIDRTGATGAPDIVLVIDSFTKGFRPKVAGAAQRVLKNTGRSVECSAKVCCGLTLISAGQLARAKKTLARAASLFDDGTDRPIVVIEPSCAAAFKKDLPELVQTEAARLLSRRIRSFAAMVTEPLRAEHAGRRTGAHSGSRRDGRGHSGAR